MQFLSCDTYFEDEKNELWSSKKRRRTIFIPNKDDSWWINTSLNFLFPFQEPWTDLLFVNKIDMEITESVRFWVKHALGPQKKPMDGKMTGQWSDKTPETGTNINRGQTMSVRNVFILSRAAARFPA